MLNPFRLIKYRFQDWRFEKKMKRQRYKRGYADSDVWNFYNWFLSEIPKMLRDLRDRSYGAPELEFEEVDILPKDFISYAVKDITQAAKKNKMEIDEYDPKDFFWRYKIILTRIIYCLEQADEDKTELKNKYQEEFNKQVWGEKEENKKLSFKQLWQKFFVVDSFDEKGKPKTYRLITGEPDEELKENYFNEEKAIQDYRNKMKDEGIELIKKYFLALWD